MTRPTFTNPETLALHGGSHRAETTTGAVAVPIYQTTSYQFQDTAHAARLFGLQEMGNIYTRIMNPTNDALETRLAAMEGGAAALALGSGQAASAFCVMNLCKAGDNVVSSTDLYGGTWNLFANTLKQFGVETRFVNPEDPENFRRATDARTRCYYAETLPNPKLQVFPIGEVAKIGREFGVPLIMDNTAAPVLCRPFDHGAAVVMYSTTKWIGGHGTAIGGAVVDGGNFDWAQWGDRFPTLNKPDPSYHGAIWTEATKPMGPVAYIVRMRTCLLRDLGPALSPFNSFLSLQGLETLPVRMQRHVQNAEAVAAFLAQHPAVGWVSYPGLLDSPYRALAQRYLPRGAGAVFTFGVEGGRETGARFIEELRLISHLANVGDAKTLIIHPASTTHQQLTDEQQLAAGVSPDLVRISVGLEDVDDICWDLDRALRRATQERKGGGVSEPAETGIGVPGGEVAGSAVAG